MRRSDEEDKITTKGLDDHIQKSPRICSSSKIEEMTRLQRKNRVDSVRKCYGAKSFSSPYKHWPNFAKPPVVEQRVSDVASSLKIDQATAEIMRVEVEHFLEKNGGSCTLSEVAKALATNNNVADAYSHYKRNVFSVIGKRLLGSTLRRSKSSDKILLLRYQITIAFQALSKSNAAGKTIIDSWEKAKQSFSPHFQFPEEDRSRVGETKKKSLTSDFKKLTVNPLQQDEEAAGKIEPSTAKWQEISIKSIPPRINQNITEKEMLRAEIEARHAKHEESKRSRVCEEVERRMAEKEREQEAKRLASSLLREFTDEEERIVEEAMYGQGPPDQVMHSLGPDSVQRESMHRLRPGQWLNDEVIHYFYVMLAQRDAEMCKQDQSRKRSHFFKSFFMTKLLNEGHTDPAKDGKYEYNNVKRWGKKVPGGDLFALDKVFFPINQGRMHWICAVAFMQEKRIQFYDSMGSDGMEYLRFIFQYIQDEHKMRKNCPLRDKDEWTLVPCTRDTPRQANGKLLLL